MNQLDQAAQLGKPIAVEKLSHAMINCLREIGHNPAQMKLLMTYALAASSSRAGEASIIRGFGRVSGPAAAWRSNLPMIAATDLLASGKGPSADTSADRS